MSDHHEVYFKKSPTDWLAVSTEVFVLYETDRRIRRLKTKYSMEKSKNWSSCEN